MIFNKMLIFSWTKDTKISLISIGNYPVKIYKIIQCVIWISNFTSFIQERDIHRKKFIFLSYRISGLLGPKPLALRKILED